jgi:hypothetical protein
MIDGHIDEVLKPCPFCGGGAFVDVYMDMEFVNVIHEPTCFVCPTTWNISNAPLKMQIEVWNRRADNG